MTTVSSTVVMVALGILTISAGGACIASITAWMRTISNRADEYLRNFKDDAGVAIAGSWHLVTQVLVQSVVQGLSEGVSKAISRKIAGPDQTLRVER